MSLRWLRALLDHGITVHGQIVVCPGVNDGAILDDSLAGVLDQYPELASVACVPLGLSKFNAESAMRMHTRDEANAVLDTVHDWQDILRVLGARMVFAADEYYLMTGREFPAAETYAGFDMHEDGIGMARTFMMEFRRGGDQPRWPAIRVFRLGRWRAGNRVPGTTQPSRRHRSTRLRSHQFGAFAAAATGADRHIDR